MAKPPVPPDPAMMDPALAAAAGAVPPPGFMPPNPAMAGLEMPANPPPPPPPPPGVATQVSTANSDDNIEFNQTALMKLKVRRNFSVLRPNRPVTFRSFDVWGRGEYLARVKRAVDESDAISQVVAGLGIQNPEQWMFQAKLWQTPTLPDANILESTASAVRPGLPQPVPLS